MASMKLDSPFEFNERVIIDGDGSLIARVVQLAFESHVAKIEVSYVHNGDIKTAWIANWRLSPAPE